MRGSTPTAAEEIIFANGFSEYFFKALSEAKSKAAAPSFSPD